MEGIISAINKSKDKTLTNTDGEPVESIKAVNNLLNINMSDSDVEKLSENVKIFCKSNRRKSSKS